MYLPYYKIAKYILIITIIVVSLIYIIKFFKRKSINNFINNKGYNLKYHSSHTTKIIDNKKIIIPAIKNNYSFSFWIYMNNFYENLNYWKHIFHKGTLLKETDIIEAKIWKDIEEIVPEQSIGVWMHPNINNLRIAITTDNNYNYLEHLDIENIPSNTYIHCVINIKGNFLEFFKNGLLLNTKILKNKLIFNDKNLHFTFKKTFDGNLFNLNYIPKSLSLEEIQILFNKKPAVSQI